MSKGTARFKDEIFQLLETAALELYPDADWSGLEQSSYEWLYARLTAETAELLGYYFDQRAKNAYLYDANVRKDVRKIAKNLGLSVRERSASSVTLTITATDDVTIPIGTRFAASNGIVFVTINDLQLQTSVSLTGDVVAINADYELITYRSKGDQNEEIFLSKDDVIVNNLIVEVDGTEWEQISDISLATSTSEIYQIDFDELNRVSIRFGDGVYGKRLSTDQTILIYTFTGGGPAGNSVGPETITTMLDSFVGSGNVSEITNTLAPTGGRGADSLDSIRSQLPAQLRQIAGLINPTDISSVIQRNISWVADASMQPGHTTINGVYVPTATVYAFPTASSITEMTPEQTSELSSFVSNRGQIGVQWNIADAYEAPIEVELEVRLSNRNMFLQKDAEIKSALVDNTDSPFFFDNLGFNSTFTDNNILNSVFGVSGIVNVNINQFSKIPQPLVISGDSGIGSCFADVELGEEAEDGYFQFVATDSNSAASHFFRPFDVTAVGPTWIRSDSANFLVEEFNFESGSELNDTDGPWVKSYATKLSFKQLDKVWESDKFNGSTYNDKYLIRIQWVDENDDTQESYFHILDTSIPHTITSTELASSPLFGTAITTLANADYKKINIRIYKDQTNGSTNSILSPVGGQATILYNNHNTLFFGASPNNVFPIGQKSHIHFNETGLETNTDSWISSTGALKARINISSPFTAGNIIDIYTTPVISSTLNYKHPSEVFSLSKENIIIRFI